MGKLTGLAVSGVALGTTALGVLANPSGALGATTADRPGAAGAAAGATAGGAVTAGRAVTVGGAAAAASIAYVRDGDIYVGKGAAETRLTTGGKHSRPRWSADGRRLAYLQSGQLWTMNADGSAPRRLTTRAAAGPSWSPDGKWLAFASLSCTGGPGVYRISTTAARPQPEVLFPRDCRSEELPAEPQPTVARTGSLTDRLRTDDAVAWSPDGTKIAFRGGECESVYDTCLSVGTVASGEEQAVAAYGGGSLQNRGFAVVPGWRADGARLAWTAYQEGETPAENEPVHLVEYDPAKHTKRTVGSALDREMTYLDSTHGVVTAQYKGGSWVVIVGLSDGTRVPFRPGSQPSVRPATR